MVQMTTSTSQTSFSELLHLTAHAWRTELGRRVRPLGLSRATWMLLALASRYDGLNQTELADRLGLEGASVVRLIDQLERDGLVQRRTGEDRRIRTVHVTEKAGPIMAEISKAAAQLRKELYQDINPEDLDTAARVLTKLRAQLEKHS
jgi:MarR family transcriptional regulator, transcriptional regulator for hemolysin